MNIVYISAGIVFGKGNYEVEISYYGVDHEDEERYYLHNEDVGPRGDFLYKHFNQEGLDNGYESLNAPICTSCQTHTVEGHIYVLEADIEQGKKSLREKLIKSVETEMSRFQKNLEEIQNS